MERWLPICGFEGRYEVSDLGNVRSLIGGRGPWLKVLRQYNIKGYRQVSLTDGSRHRNYYVHRLVLRAFRGPPPSPYMQGAHLDGVRHHNAIDNLIWATVSENHAHKKLHGTQLRGAAAPTAKVDDFRVQFMRDHYVPGHRYFGSTGMAKLLGISQAEVSAIINNKRWTHLQVSPQAKLEAN